MGLVLDIMFAWSNEFKPPRGSRGVGSPAILEAVEAVGPPRGCRGAGSPVACGRGSLFLTHRDRVAALVTTRTSLFLSFSLSDGQAVGDKKNSVEPAPGTLTSLRRRGGWWQKEHRERSFSL